MSEARNYFNFEARRPSAAQCLKRARDLARVAGREGFGSFTLHWGEQWLEFFQQSPGRWYGSGWIGRVSGQDMARDLTPAP